MLTLTRKLGQACDIYVGDIKCRVILNRIQNGQVRLSFDVPQGVIVLREELTVELGANHDGAAATASNEQARAAGVVPGQS